MTPIIAISAYMAASLYLAVRMGWRIEAEAGEPD